MSDFPIRELRHAVAGLRRKASQQLGALAQTYHAAMAQWDAAKADGVPLQARLGGLEKTLRVAWPFTRTWHYACDECADTGWQPATCHKGSCGRPFKLPTQRYDDRTGQGTCTDGHAFVRPCFCAKGRVFSQQITRQRTPADAVASAAKTSRSLSRLGR